MSDAIDISDVSDAGLFCRRYVILAILTYHFKEKIKQLLLQLPFKEA